MARLPAGAKLALVVTVGMLMGILVLIFFQQWTARDSQRDPRDAVALLLDHPAVVDFKAGCVGQQLEGAITFRNTTPDQVLLYPPKTTCGCAAVDLLEPAILQTGESIDLDMKFTVKQEGENEQKALFAMGVGEAFHYSEVIFLAEGVKGVDAPDLLDFGIVGDGDLPARKAITIQCHELWGAPVVQLEGEGFAIEHESGATYRVTLHRLAHDFAIGHITVHSREVDGPGKRIRVQARRNMALEVVPATVVITPGSSDQPFVAELKVSMHGDVPLSKPTYQWQGEAPEYQVRIEEAEPNNAWYVRISGSRVTAHPVVRNILDLSFPESNLSKHVPITVLSMASLDEASP